MLAVICGNKALKKLNIGTGSQTPTSIESLPELSKRNKFLTQITFDRPLAIRKVSPLLFNVKENAE